MLGESRDRILHEVPDSALVLDVGGWAKPFHRADWVIDLLPYSTRGMYGDSDPEPERFSADTWVQTDICGRTPWPFDDGQFDFVVCSHTLEDIRDPIWVCSEIARVGKAGYIEVPSRLEEQTYGVHGPWVGWAHHHWLVDKIDSGLEFVFKSHAIHGQPEKTFEKGFNRALKSEERVLTLFWKGEFSAMERIFIGPGEIDDYLAQPVARHGHGRSSSRDQAGRRRLGRLRGRS